MLWIRNSLFTFFRLCLIHVVEVRWAKQLMGVCLRYFSKTMGLLGLPVLRLHARTLSLAVLVMLLLVFCFNQRIGTMGIFSLTSKILVFPHYYVGKSSHYCWWIWIKLNCLWNIECPLCLAFGLIHLLSSVPLPLCSLPLLQVYIYIYIFLAL